MSGQTIQHHAILRNAQHLRTYAIVKFWHRWAELLSPRLPKIFPSEF